VPAWPPRWTDVLLAGAAAGFAGAYWRARLAQKRSRESFREMEAVAHSLAESLEIPRIAASAEEALSRITPLVRMDLSLVDEDQIVREVWTLDPEGARAGLARRYDAPQLGALCQQDRLDKLSWTETPRSLFPRDLHSPPRDRKTFRLPMHYGRDLVGHLEVEFADPLDNVGIDQLRTVYRLATDAFYAERKYRLATTDTLTDLYLRRYFDIRLSEEVRRQARYPRPLAVAAFDLDHFKQVNDRLGHAAGDEALRRFAEILKEEVRGQDICGRRGGEEFAAFFPETDAETARRICERIRSEVERRRFTIESAEIRMTVSAGVTGFRAGENAESLLSRADSALYRAKDQGRNRVIVLPAEV
jgi:diguanylate cyclase (GGDEF)-like protein